MWSIYICLTACLISGILFGNIISVTDAVLFAIAFVAVSILLGLFRKKIDIFKIGIVLVTLIGILGYHYQNSEEIRKLYPLDEKYITIYGRIIDLPRKESDVNIYDADVMIAYYNGKEYEINERVRITSPIEFQFGEFITAEGFLKTFPKPLNKGNFDTAVNYKAKGIYFRMYAEEARKLNINGKTYSPFYYVNLVKSKIADLINENYEADNAAILQAIFVGDKKSFSDDFEDELYESNMTRLFYPSYLHISFIISIVGALSGILNKKRRDTLLILMLLLYAFYNSGTSYIVKTACTLALVTYSKKHIGYSSYMDILAITVGAILLVNPLIIYNIGFVFSTTANILIYYFVPVVAEKLNFIKNHQFKYRMSLWIIISIGLIPLQAYYFYVTTPYSVLLNLLYIPIITILWILEPIELLLGNIGLIYVPISFLTKGLVLFIRHTPKLISKLPFYNIFVAKPKITGIIIFYLVLFIIHRKVRRKRKNDMAVKVAWMVIAGVSINIFGGFISEQNKLKIDVVNVRNGDGIVISSMMNETIIIDGGGRNAYSDYNYGEKEFLPFLKRNGHTCIDFAVVTHYDSDHADGVIAAMEKLKVKEVMIPNCMEENENRKIIERLAEEKNIKLSRYNVGTELIFPSGLTLSIISPNDEDLLSDDENDTSYGIRAVYGEFSMLFTGDMTKYVEENHAGEWGETDILKVAHHGSDSSTSEMFLKEVKPKIAIISVGENNPYNLPSENVISRLRENGVKILRTDELGNIEISAKKDGSTILRKFER